MNINNKIFEVITGSQAYGTNIETSDTDVAGIYMQSIDELIGFGYNPQIDITKDLKYYELRRYLELLQKGNPTVLELLYTPRECILIKDPVMDILIEHRDKFLTKQCRNSFAGMAISQIKKAKRLDKKMNWEKAKVERKTPLDFCYITEDGKEFPLSSWLQRKGFKQEYCGLSKVNFFTNTYSLYYDYSAQYAKDGNHRYDNTEVGFRGIVFEDSNDIRLSSIPKDMLPVGIIYYSKDSYSTHCRDYKEYQEWLENRNEQRYVDVKGHNQMIDGKNVMHCVRLLHMATEIATEGWLQVKRPNAEELIKIRKGEVSLNSIIEHSENIISTLDDLFLNSKLPDKVDPEFVNKLLLIMRHEYYGK